MVMKIVKMTRNWAIIKDGDRIIRRPISEQARKIMDWHYKNTPANKE